MPAAPRFVRYLSTRDPRPSPRTLSFEDVLLAGLAEDGGLYVPDHLPALSAEDLRGFAGQPYAELAACIVGLFAGDGFSSAELQPIAERAYRGFRHAAVAPLVQLDERLWLMELFHGPTLAFKDLALQLVGLLFDAALARRREHVTIIGATSGDTGSAALAACRDRDAIDIFMLYPHGRISEVQRRQMTTVEAVNAHAHRDRGHVRRLPGSGQGAVRRRRAAARAEPRGGQFDQLGANRGPDRVLFRRGRGARRAATARCRSACRPAISATSMPGTSPALMGLPVERLVIGTNRNDILARYISTGDMTIAPVEPSLSPSMDIQVSSNFERLLFELKGRNGAAVAEAMKMFRQSGSLPADDQALRVVRGLFSAHKVDDTLTMQTIADTYARSGILIDPHTAVAVAAARAELGAQPGEAPMVALATAHPAKFPDAVERATGIRPTQPPALGELFEKRERMTVLANDFDAVKRFIRARARRAGAAA